MSQPSAKELLAFKTAMSLKSKLNFVTLRDTLDIMMHSDGKYVPESGLIEQLAQEELGPLAATKTIREIRGHISRTTIVERSNFDKEIEWLSTKKCLVNLKTGQTKSHDPQILTTIQIPVTFNLGAKCPEILKFLNEIAPEDVDTLLDFISYCLWRDNSLKKALMLLGEKDNGKSTFIRLCERFLGATNVSNVSLQKISEDRFALADLHNKLVNSCADLSAKPIKDTSVFRQLTGNDVIRAEEKFKSPFEFTFFGKLIFSANRLPYSYDDLPAYFIRWIIVPFPNEFTAANADRYKLAKITTDEELSGLLNLAIERLPRVLRDGIQARDITEEEIRERYRNNADSENKFIDDAIADHDRGLVGKKALYEVYKAYCKKRGLTAGTPESLGRKMKKRKYKELSYFGELNGKNYDDRQISEQGKRNWYWINLKLTQEIAEEFLSPKDVGLAIFAADYGILKY